MTATATAEPAAAPSGPWRRPAAVQHQVEQARAAVHVGALLGEHLRQRDGHLVRGRTGQVVDAVALDLAHRDGAEGVHDRLGVPLLGQGPLGPRAQVGGGGVLVGEDRPPLARCPLDAPGPRHQPAEGSQEQQADEHGGERRQGRQLAGLGQAAVEQAGEPVDQAEDQVVLVVLRVQQLAAHQ